MKPSIVCMRTCPLPNVHSNTHNSHHKEQVNLRLRSSVCHSSHQTVTVCTHVPGITAVCSHNGVQVSY